MNSRDILIILIMDNQPPPTTLAESLMEKISEQGVRPRPRSFFWLRNGMMWLAALLSVLLGALSIASLIFRLTNVLSVVLPPGAPTPRLAEWFTLLPFMWLLALVAFGLLTFVEIRHTERGYRYHFLIVASGVVGVSAILGVLLYVMGSGYVVDRLAGKFVPWHHEIEEMRELRWFRPEEGFLSGEVETETRAGSSFTLRDASGTLWQVEIAAVVPAAERVLVVSGNRLGVRGEVIELEPTEARFIACIIKDVSVVGKSGEPPLRRMGMMRGEHLLEIENERNEESVRSTECEGVRPPISR